MRKLIVGAIILVVVFAGFGFRKKKEKKKSPNIIFILADDLGYGDLGCYGQRRFQTPNIDQLAQEGMLFTRMYSGSPVCAPSRSALLTGLHTGHTPIRGNKGVKPEGQFPLNDTLLILPEIFRQHGYATGAFGKWGLGFPGSTGDPMNQGFDEFFGYNCQTLAHNYYPDHLYHNRERVLLPENAGSNKGIYAAQLIHQKSLQFIKDHKDEPFFLFIPTVLPHAELVAPDSVMAKYSGRFLPETAYHGVDSGLKYRKGPYGSQPEPHAAYAAMVGILDSQVGEVLDLIKKLGIDDETIVVFSSDNGPHREGGGDPDYFNSNGSLKGYKRDLYEGGIRVPFIVKWNDHIRKDTETNHIVAFWDLLPTFADVLGENEYDKTDGISFLPTLLNRSGQKDHEYLYWEFYEMSGRIAVLKGPWKLIRYNVAGEPETMLFKLDEDPKETTNLAAKYPLIVRELDSLARISHVPSPDFQMTTEKVAE